VSFKVLLVKKSESKERRSFRRYPTTSRGKINIQVMHSLFSSKKDLEGSLINISNGGMCISLQASLKLKQVAIISLPFLHGKTEIPTLGEIHWLRKISREKKEILVGIRFLF